MEIRTYKLLISNFSFWNKNILLSFANINVEAVH